MKNQILGLIKISKNINWKKQNFISKVKTNTKRYDLTIYFPTLDWYTKFKDFCIQNNTTVRRMLRSLLMNIVSDNIIYPMKLISTYKDLKLEFIQSKYIKMTLGLNNKNNKDKFKRFCLTNKTNQNRLMLLFVYDIIKNGLYNKNHIRRI